MSPSSGSLLRTSVSPTIMSGGFRRNVIPSQAEAMLDVRGLPDEDPEAFYAHMAAVVANPDVEIVPQPIYRPASPPSPIDNEMFAVLESVSARLFPEAVTLPTMLTGATDMAQVRAKGVACYGFRPGSPRGGPEHRRRRPRRRRADPGRLAAQAGAVPLVLGAGHRRIVLIARIVCGHPVGVANEVKRSRRGRS